VCRCVAAERRGRDILPAGPNKIAVNAEIEARSEETPPIFISADTQKKKKRLTPGEYRTAMWGESWKFRLIKAIDEALEYSPDKESFILNMEYEGYEVRWDDTHKYILFRLANRNLKN